MEKSKLSKLFIPVLSLLLYCSIHAQNKFPLKEWDMSNPEKYGYDSTQLKLAHQYLIDSMKTTGLVVVVSGEMIFKYGNIKQVSYIASCRKSLLSMLYGKYVENGIIDLNKTVGELGFDDVGGLLPIEKTAKVNDLITARSGVYHHASNPGDDKADAPSRGSKKPGGYFLYNNWDFNVAGAAFEKMTGRNIYSAFQTDIAEPIGMEDFDRSLHIKGGNLGVSSYPSYHFHLSTRDMARVGYLMLRKGKWLGEQVISPEWVDKITSVVTPLNEMNPPFRRNAEFGYGYMWWIFQGKANSGAFKGAYTARGSMGQYITVLPTLDMVVAHKTDAVYERRSTWRTYYKLLHMITSAKTAQ